MQYEVYEDPPEGWAWRSIDKGRTITISVGFKSQDEAEQHLANTTGLCLIKAIGIVNEMEITNNEMLRGTKRAMKAIRLSAILVAVAAAFFGMFMVYENLVKPQQAVWNEEEPVHWPSNKIPITIYSEDYPEALEEAVYLWNSQAEFKLFQVDKEAPTIRIRQGTLEVGTEAAEWGAGTFVAPDMSRGEIVVYIPLMVGTDLAVLHHELGHVLGLAHDRSYTMKPITKEEIGGPQRMVRAQDKDIEALRDRYQYHQEKDG